MNSSGAIIIIEWEVKGHQFRTSVLYSEVFFIWSVLYSEVFFIYLECPACPL